MLELQENASLVHDIAGWSFMICVFLFVLFPGGFR